MKEKSKKLKKVKTKWIAMAEEKGWKVSTIDDYYKWLKLFCNSYEIRTYMYFIQQEETIFLSKYDITVPICIIYIENNIIKPVFPGEDQSYYSEAYNTIFNNIGNSLYDLNLVRTNIMGFPLSVYNCVECFDFKNYVKSKVKNNYNPHLFGEKSKHLKIDYFIYEDYFRFFEDFTDFDINYFKKWRSYISENLFNSFFYIQAMKGNKQPIFQTIKVDGELASILICFEVHEDFILDMISVLPYPKFKPYSLYAISHIDAIRYAQSKNYKSVRCGEIGLANKKDLGFDIENLHSIDFSNDFKNIIKDIIS